MKLPIEYREAELDVDGEDHFYRIHILLDTEINYYHWDLSQRDINNTSEPDEEHEGDTKTYGQALRRALQRAEKLERSHKKKRKEEEGVDWNGR